MKKWLSVFIWIITIAIVGIQFFPVQRDEFKPTTNADFIELYEPPNHISAKIRVSCYDCHSNQTQYPWYSNIQPFGWIIQNHIKDGKKDLNFSEFDNLSNRMKRSKLESTISQIKDDKMPFQPYLFLHRSAKIDSTLKKEIISHLDSLVNSTNR